MDILNWLYLAKNKFVRTTLGSTKDLMIFGAKVGFNKRGDLYQNYAMSIEDFLAINRPYKVFTALLTQRGGSVYGPVLGDETLNEGITYTIDNLEAGDSLIPYGAPNNEIGTSFICNQEISNWGNPLSQLSFDSGAPVATVLENTIGNIWFTYNDIGDYHISSDALFIENKTYITVNGQSRNMDGNPALIYSTYFNAIDNIALQTLVPDNPNIFSNDALLNTPIEIRVYN